MERKSRFSEVWRKNLLDNSQKCLWTSEGEKGLSYLVEERGLSQDVIKTFGLGYVPSLAKNQLAGRIILPLYDASDNLIALTSRLVVPTKHELPVYWHEKYKKSFYLFGINQAKQYMRKWKFVTLVEGQFDVLQLYKCGIRNVVGLCSSKMSEAQIAVIKRYCSDMVVILDNDTNQSGQVATANILKQFQSYCNIVSVDLPLQSDPDEFVRQNGGNALKTMLKKELFQMRDQYENEFA